MVLAGENEALGVSIPSVVRRPKPHPAKDRAVLNIRCVGTERFQRRLRGDGLLPLLRRQLLEQSWGFLGFARMHAVTPSAGPHNGYDLFRPTGG